MEYYAAGKRTRLLTHTSMCVTLTDITLSYRIQAHKGNLLYIYAKFKNRQNYLDL